MAQEILSIKLYELDKKFAQLHSRIQLSEMADSEQIGEDIRQLRKESAENKLILQNKMKYSRAKKVKQLSDAYERIEEIIKEVQKEPGESQAEWQSDEGSAEGLTLLAEYSLDFAIQAADEALLVSLEAIRAQMERQKKEEA